MREVVYVYLQNVYPAKGGELIQMQHFVITEMQFSIQTQVT